jgi:transcriptional regulator with XRE-family HTH domain/tetratricopeptide (TPR) repeat protein
VTGDLGHALREARKQSGMSFSKFARLTGYSESHLRSVENGHRAITLSVARAYDTVLKTGSRFQAFVADAPLTWDPAGTLSAVSRVLSRSDLDRRAFVIASGAALAGIAGSWKLALDHPSPLHGDGTRQVSDDLITNIEQRLGLLRHLDDELGSSQLARLARGELDLIARMLRDGSYTDTAGRRLYSLAAEAGRQAAWDYFDQGEHGTAQAYFETALRASATAGDQIAGAYALSFLAVQCYSTRQPQTAVSLLETAQGTVGRSATPRMTAMLAARSARALSKAGDRRACARKLLQAHSALDNGPHPDDPETLYWVTRGEVEMIAGSSALDLGDPAEAIRRFDAAIKADYRGDDQYPRSHAIYMARAAEAHLVLHDLDAAVIKAAHAVRCMRGVGSARSASTLASLRKKLAGHAASSAVRTFLEETTS